MANFSCARIAAVLVLVVASTALCAEEPSTVAYKATGETVIELTPGRNRSAAGEMVVVNIVAKFPWLACDATGIDVSGSFRVFVDGVEYPPPTFTFVERGCGAYPWRVSSAYVFYDLVLGDHQFTAEFSGTANVAPARSAPVTLSTRPQFEAPLADGATLKLWVGDPLFDWGSGDCSLVARIGTPGTPGWPGQPPPGTTSIAAVFSVESSGCEYHSGGFPEQAPLLGNTRPVARRVLVGRDPPLPEGTIAYAYGPTRDDATAHWYELPTSTAGNNAHFLVEDGGVGDDALTRDGRMRAIVALAMPAYSAVAGRYQDLWWSGPAENGWGLSLTQHRDILFGELFIYDSEGNARWLAMPAGAWNASKTAYTGALFRPRGTPYNLPYDVSQFSIGPAVGTLTLTPSSLQSMRLDYVIDGVRGTKQIERIPFGPPDPIPQLPFDDLWWGGAAQNGWGLVVAQQYRSLFTLWYAYDERGDATWFVAPSSIPGPGSIRGVDIVGTRYRYTADLYRPVGSPWIGAYYDPARHALEKMGSISMHFGPEYGDWMCTHVGTTDRCTSISRVPF